MIDRPLYVDKIMAYADTPFVKILTGVRRCGKSTILKMIMERLKTERNIPAERMISCRYDSMEFEDMTAKQMYAQLKERLCPDGKTYLFLDEVQEIRGWEKVVNSLASDFDVDLYITGSNSRMMSSEISTYLTGRYVSFRIFTLSFSEYLMFRSKFTTVGEPKAELANYVRLGGFPATHLQEFSQDEIYTIVRDIYNSTIFSDIVKRNQVRKIDQLERVVKYTILCMLRQLDSVLVSLLRGYFLVLMVGLHIMLIGSSVCLAPQLLCGLHFFLDCLRLTMQTTDKLLLCLFFFRHIIYGVPYARL